MIPTVTNTKLVPVADRFARASTTMDGAPHEQPTTCDVDLQLIERRKAIRLLPCPVAIERDDDETWSQWDELMAQAIQRRQDRQC
jgi:hypothetical protein